MIDSRTERRISFFFFGRWDVIVCSIAQEWAFSWQIYYTLSIYNKYMLHTDLIFIFFSSLAHNWILDSEWVMNGSKVKIVEQQSSRVCKSRERERERENMNVIT